MEGHIDELPSAIRALSVSFCGDEDSDIFTPNNKSNSNSDKSGDNDDVVSGIQALSMALTTAENIDLIRNDGTFFSPAIRALSAPSFGEESAKENKVDTTTTTTSSGVDTTNHDEKSEQQQQQQQHNPMLEIMKTSSQDMETVSKSWDEEVLLQRALDNSSGEIVFGESNDDDDDDCDESDYGDANYPLYTPTSINNIFHDWNKNGEGNSSTTKSLAMSTNEILIGSESPTGDKMGVTSTRIEEEQYNNSDDLAFAVKALSMSFSEDKYSTEENKNPADVVDDISPTAFDMNLIHDLEATHLVDGPINDNFAASVKLKSQLHIQIPAKGDYFFACETNSDHPLIYDEQEVRVLQVSGVKEKEEKEAAGVKPVDAEKARVAAALSKVDELTKTIKMLKTVGDAKQLKAEEETRLKVMEDTRRKSEAARLKAARLKAGELSEAIKTLKEKEVARLKTEEETRLKAMEEARRQAEEGRLRAAKLKADELSEAIKARITREGLRLAEEARLEAEEEAKLQEEAEAVQEEAKLKEGRLRAAKLKADELSEAIKARITREGLRLAEEARLEAEEEAKLQEEAEAVQEEAKLKEGRLRAAKLKADELSEAIEARITREGLRLAEEARLEAEEEAKLQEEAEAVQEEAKLKEGRLRAAKLKADELSEAIKARITKEGLRLAEEARLETEEEAKLQEEAEAVQEEARQKAEEEARLAKFKAEEEARLKAEEEARLKAEEEARLKAEEEARLAKLKAEEEARQKAEEEARLAKLKAEEEARLKAEEEARVAKLKAEEEARLKAEEEARLAKLKAEEEARLKAEEEARVAKLKAEEEARLKAEEEARLAKLKAEEDARQKAEEEARLAKLKAEEEARQKAEEEAKLAKLKAEEEARQKAEEEAKLAKLKAKEDAKRKVEVKRLAEEEGKAEKEERKAAEEDVREEEARLQAEEDDRLGNMLEAFQSAKRIVEEEKRLQEDEVEVKVLYEDVKAKGAQQTPSSKYETSVAPEKESPPSSSRNLNEEIHQQAKIIKATLPDDWVNNGSPLKTRKMTEEERIALEKAYEEEAQSIILRPAAQQQAIQSFHSSDEWDFGNFLLGVVEITAIYILLLAGFIVRVYSFCFKMKHKDD